MTNRAPVSSRQPAVDPVAALTKGGGLGRVALRSLLPTLLIDVALPIVIYVLLVNAGVSVTVALAAGGGVSALRVLAELIRRRRLNGLALVVLIGFAVGVTTSLVTGDPRFAIAKDGVLTGAFGVVLIGSLLIGRPLMFYVVRSALGGDPAAWDRLWRTSRVFPRGMAVTTGLLGLVLVLDAVMRVIVAYTMPVRSAGTTAQLIGYPLWIIFLIFGRFYGRRTRRAFVSEQRGRTGPTAMGAPGGA